MIIDELHPNIISYYEQIEKVLEQKDSSILEEFRKRILDEEPKVIFLWLDGLLQKDCLPKEIDEPLTNLYWSIR